jgi:AraC family transcriptional activator of mtrCDE
VDGAPPAPARERANLNLVLSENAGPGERLDLLCGRFVLSAPHNRLLRAYLPTHFVVRAGPRKGSTGAAPATGAQRESLVALMRIESADARLGGHVMLSALSTALFALALRLASEGDDAPAGLLALAGRSRLEPAVAAMVSNPAHPWSLPELAQLCNMSRATLARHFQETLGRSASDLLTDIRMTIAANVLRTSSASTGAVAEAVGYQSEAAFQRAFKHHLGVTPAGWRRETRARERLANG